MDKPYLISYSRIDGAEHSWRLHDELLKGPPSIPVWHDQRMAIHASVASWPHQIDEALKQCAGVLFVVTGDSVQDASVVADELYSARMYKKTIIPLIFDTEAPLPFLYRRIQSVSFVGDFNRGLAELRLRIEWLETPEGRIYALEFQRGVVERDLARNPDEVSRKKIRAEISRIDEEIGQLRHAAERPLEARQEIQHKIELAITKETQRRDPENRSRVATVNRPPASPPLRFFDRIAETRVIAQFLRDPSRRLLTVTGRGGVGKTAMVCRVLGELELGQFTDEAGVAIAVAGIVYLGSGSDKPISFENFSASLRRLLPIHVREEVDDEWTSARDLRSQLDTVISRFTDRPVIVLLDNFEELLETQRIVSQDVQQLLEALLELPQHSVKVIMTTRETPAGLSLHRPERQMFLPLDEGLKSPYAEDLLRSLDQEGRLGLRSASDAVLGEVRERTLGIPRALEVFCTILNDPYSSLDEVLSNTERYLPEEVVKRLSAEAFHRLDRMAQRVVEALAVFGRPVIPEAVDFVLLPFEPATASEPTMRRLVGMYLVRRRESGRCYLHPVDQAYALSCIPEVAASETTGSPESSYNLKNVSRRAAEYFRMIRTDESTWLSLSDLSPQLSEFDLLIAAGADSEAFDVFKGILPYLDLWGYRRQIARMAEQIRLAADDPARAQVLAASGNAYHLLGDFDLAVKRYEDAIQAAKETEPGDILGWNLQLAYCHLGRNDEQAASRLFNLVLQQSPESEAEIRVDALIGLGGIAMRRADRVTAEALFFSALDSYVPFLGVKLSQVQEEVELSAVETPSGLATADPASWFFLDVLTLKTESDASPETVPIKSVLYGVALETSDVSSEAPSRATGPVKPTIDVFPLQVNVTLAGIWISLARLYFRWDQISEAQAACGLAAEMYVELEDDVGILDALDLMRQIMGISSARQTEALLEDQQRLLDRAQRAGNHELTARILLVIAQTNLDIERPKEAEAAYTEVHRLGLELENRSLETEGIMGGVFVMRLRGDYDSAADRLEMLLKQIGEDQELHGQIEFELGQIEIGRYKPKVAATHFEESSRSYAIAGKYQGCIAAESQLGALEIENRDYSAAVRRHERIADLAKDTGIPSTIASALASLAGAYSAGGNRQRAVETCEEATQVADKIDVPRSRAEIKLTLASIMSDQRQFDAAKEACQQARETYNRLGDIRGQIDALHLFASIYSRTLECELQLQAARETGILADKLVDPEQKRRAKVAVALALSDLGSHPEAIELMAAAVSEQPTDARAVGNLGSILFDAGRYEQSIEESKRALDLDPRQSFVLRNIGHAYLALGKDSEAEKAYRRAIDERRGGEDFHESIRYVKELLAKHPDLPRGSEMLALLEAAQRDLERRETPPQNASSGQSR